MENALILSLVVCCVPVLRRLVFSRSNTTTDTPLGRVLHFDFIRGVSIIAVILIHVLWVMEIFNLFPHLLTPYFFNAAFRFAVPVFFIASGALLSFKDTNLNLYKFFVSKFWRLVVPYVLVVAIISLWRSESVTMFLHNLVSGETLVPFYFFVVLMQLYVIFPFVRTYTSSQFFLPVSLLVSAVCATLPFLWNIGPIPFFGQYFFFFAYGMAKGSEFAGFSQDKNRELKWWFLMVFLYFTFFFISPAYYYNTQFMFGVAAFNLLLFLFLHIRSRVPFLTSTITRVGENSLWIFLTHFPIVVLLIQLLERGFSSVIVATFAISAASIVVSILVASICRFMYGRMFSVLKIRSSSR